MAFQPIDVNGICASIDMAKARTPAHSKILVGTCHNEVRVFGIIENLFDGLRKL